MKSQLRSAIRLALSPGYGPWATTLDTELGGVGLSIFWKRRMTMLSTLNTTSSRLTWRASALLAAIALGAFASPLLYLSRATMAQAAEAAEESTARPGEPSVEYLPKLTLAEERILAELEKPTEFEFTETPLQDAVDYLRDFHQLQIQLDTKALEDAGIDTDTPFTRKLYGISLRAALRLLLGSVDMTFDIRDEVLLITTKEEAATWLITRTYPIADLLEGKDYDNLVEAITNSVDSKSWDEYGGAGSISEVTGSKSLVISQTRDVHDKVLTLLRSLRAARKSAAEAK
jgi:hypothetical protein